MSESDSSFRVLLLICGGIAAYKSLLLIRELRKRGMAVRCAMTRSAKEFVTPLSVSSLSGDHVYSALFSLTDEAEMGHIELSRQADVVLVMPATANILAKMAHGIADDLVSTILMATDKPVIVVPSMNVRMWEHRATQRNVHQLLRDGIQFVGPMQGDMACGEYGYGRMVEPTVVVQRIERFREGRDSCVLILGSIPKENADGLLSFVSPKAIQDEILEVLHTSHIEVWCGLLKEPCSIPHERIENEQDLLVRVRDEKRTVFSLGQWVGDVPAGVQDLSDETNPASVLMRLSK